MGGDDRVQDAFRATDRRGFLPPAQVRHADWDQPLAIGHGQTRSQPLSLIHI